MVSDTRVTSMDDLIPRGSRESQPSVEHLVDRQLSEFKAALANRVAAQFQDQERLLEEARGQLALHKEALFNSERARHDLEERFDRERQALNDEIRQLKHVTHAYEERFGQEKGALSDGVFEATVSPNERVEQDPPTTLADTEQGAAVGEGTPAT